MRTVVFCALTALACGGLTSCSKPSETPPSSSQHVRAESAQVYLADMGPVFAQVFTNGHWGFGGKGTLGNVDLIPIKVGGKAAPQGIGAQPPSSGASRVIYQIDRQFARFSGGGAIADTATGPQTALVFRIKGDGRELWKSDAVIKPGTPVTFDVDTSSVTMLELIIDCPGSNHDAHAVWIDPILTRAK